MNKLFRLPNVLLFNSYCFYKKWISGFKEIDKIYNAVLPISYYLLEAISLFELAKKSEYPIVELGVYGGNGSVVLAEGSARGNKQPVYAVDTHLPLNVDGHFYPDTRLLFQLNILKTHFWYLIKPIYQFSFDVVNDFKEKIGLLCIDTTHESVMRDFIEWAPLVVKGGIITLRNCKNEKVACFIKEKISANPDYINLGVVQGMQIFLKK